MTHRLGMACISVSTKRHNVRRRAYTCSYMYMSKWVPTSWCATTKQRWALTCTKPSHDVVSSGKPTSGPLQRRKLEAHVEKMCVSCSNWFLNGILAENRDPPYVWHVCMCVGTSFNQFQIQPQPGLGERLTIQKLTRSLDLTRFEMSSSDEREEDGGRDGGGGGQDE